MDASSPQPLPMAPASAVRLLLATERDAHRRQRELVRASLMLCPAKPDPAAGPPAR